MRANQIARITCDFKMGVINSENYKQITLVCWDIGFACARWWLQWLPWHLGKLQRSLKLSSSCLSNICFEEFDWGWAFLFQFLEWTLPFWKLPDPYLSFDANCYSFAFCIVLQVHCRFLLSEAPWYCWTALGYASSSCMQYRIDPGINI